MENERAATRAAATLKLVLNDVIDDFAAINVVFGNIDPLFPRQILQNPAAERTQIARNDEVVFLRFSTRIPQMPKNRVARRRAH